MSFLWKNSLEVNQFNLISGLRDWDLGAFKSQSSLLPAPASPPQIVAYWGRNESVGYVNRNAESFATLYMQSLLEDLQLTVHLPAAWILCSWVASDEVNCLKEKDTGWWVSWHLRICRSTQGRQNQHKAKPEGETRWLLTLPPWISQNVFSTQVLLFPCFEKKML